MARKTKSYIKAPKKQDKVMFQAFRCCHYLTAKQLAEITSHNRVKNMILDKLVEKCHYQQGTKKMMVYRLTNKGRQYAEKTHALRNFYRSSSTTHDLKISEHYFKCSQDIRDTWQTEGDLRDRWDEQLNSLYEVDRDRYKEYYNMFNEGKISMPDYAIRNEIGVEICHDVVSQHYSEELKEAKVTTGKILTGRETILHNLK